MNRGIWILAAFCLSSTANAQNLFKTGQDAEIILSPYGAGATASGFSTPGRIACDSTRFYVADTRNNRVLIWNSFPTVNDQPADVVVGQPDFSSNFSGLGPDRLNWPYSVFSDGIRLFVADTYNNRILIWNTIPKQNGQPADIVLGQWDFDSNSPLFGPTFVYEPWDVCFDGTRLYAACARRGVLVWNNLPTYNNQPADIILGQKDFYSTAPQEPQAWSFDSPRAVASDGARLVVQDYTNQRLLVWNAPPTENGQPADLVLGQKDFTSCDGWSTIQTAHGGMWIYKNMLFSAGGETYLWNTFPTRINQPPDAKLPWLLSQGICYNGRYLFVCNEANHRILIYDHLPTSTSPDDPAPRPILVLGQKDFDTNVFYGRQAVNGRNATLVSTGKKLLWGGDLFSRVIVFQDMPQTDGAAADNIISMFDWLEIPERTPPGTDAPMSQLGPAWSDGCRYFLPSREKGIFVWDRIPTADHVWYDHTLFPECQCGSLSRNLDDWGVLIHRDRLFVTQPTSRRILIWNSIPFTDPAREPDIILNHDIEWAYIATDGKRLAVGGTMGVRIWNTIPVNNDQPFDFILTGSADRWVHGVTGVFVYNDMLFVSDTDGHRVCIWTTFPTSADQPFDVVLGQSDPSGRMPGATRSKMIFPKNLWFDGDYLWVMEHKFGDRLLGFRANIDPVPPKAPTNLEGTVVSNNQVNLTWQDHASNERGFVLEYKKDNEAEFKMYAELAGNIDYFPVSGLDNNSNYTFRIKADNRYGQSAYSNEYLLTTLQNINHPPNTPDRPYPADTFDFAQNNEWFLFHWNCGDPDEGDRVLYDFYLGNVNPPPLFQKNVNAKLYHDEYLAFASGVKYYWRIVATDQHGAVTSSPIWSFRTSGGVHRVYLTTASSPGGTTNPAPGKWEFTSDHKAYAIALPDSLYRFAGWEGDVPEYLKMQNPLYMKLTSDAQITARFVPDVTVVPSDRLMGLSFYLDQNFPNPFNAATCLKYSVADRGKVNLSIYNIRGELVKTMVNTFQEAGYYNIIWDGIGQGSGVYFMVLSVHNSKISFHDTKKLVLIK